MERLQDGVATEIRDVLLRSLELNVQFLDLCSDLVASLDVCLLPVFQQVNELDLIITR